MRLRYTDEARRHIESIHDYIAERNPSAATRVVMRIRAAAARLSDFPYMGRLGAVPGTHEWVVRGLPYIIVYYVNPDTAEIIVIDVFHGHRIVRAVAAEVTLRVHASAHKAHSAARSPCPASRRA